ncbi:MAG: glycosyltransferase family 2 protein [Campylobacterales bacterium]
MKVALIVTTYNWPEALDIVLKSALTQSKLPDEIIIADDGSDERTVSLIKKISSISPAAIIHSWQEDRGFRAAMSRNKAIARATSDYIVLIDGDMILHPDFIRDHSHRAKPKCFVQGSRVILTQPLTEKLLTSATPSPIHWRTPGIGNRLHALRSPLLSRLIPSRQNLRGTKTCNMAFWREDCILVNGFNEAFEGWGREDTEFVARLMHAGIKRINLKFSAIAYHLWHKENKRDALEQNDLLLRATIEKKLVRCDRGIDQYLTNR